MWEKKNQSDRTGRLTHCKIADEEPWTSSLDIFLYPESPHCFHQYEYSWSSGPGDGSTTAATSAAEDIDMGHWCRDLPLLAELLTAPTMSYAPCWSNLS